MTVLMFKERFAALVREGSKPHTIRPERKRPIKVGDALSLRQWSGAAYRSKQIVLREAVCIAVQPIRIDAMCDGGEIYIDHTVRLSTPGRAHLARRDGFVCCSDMLAWFEEVHGLPFHGVLISWGQP
jgi:hypothetical protein